MLKTQILLDRSLIFQPGLSAGLTLPASAARQSIERSLRFNLQFNARRTGKEGLKRPLTLATAKLIFSLVGSTD